MLLNHVKKIVFIALLVLPLASSLSAALEPTSATKPVDQSIMVLGDSISAAFGLPREQGWVNLLDLYLQQQEADQNYHVINASISGETTGGALSRLPKLLSQYQPDIIIIELGPPRPLRPFVQVIRRRQR